MGRGAGGAQGIPSMVPFHGIRDEKESPAWLSTSRSERLIRAMFTYRHRQQSARWVAGASSLLLEGKRVEGDSELGWVGGWWWGSAGVSPLCAYNRLTVARVQGGRRGVGGVDVRSLSSAAGADELDPVGVTEQQNKPTICAIPPSVRQLFPAFQGSRGSKSTRENTRSCMSFFSFLFFFFCRRAQASRETFRHECVSRSQQILTESQDVRHPARVTENQQQQEEKRDQPEVAPENETACRQMTGGNLHVVLGDFLLSSIKWTAGPNPPGSARGSFSSPSSSFPPQQPS